MRKLFTLSLVLIFSAGLSLFAQQKMKISGVITSADDNTAVIGAVVSVDGTQTAVLSDVDGRYMINANVGQTLTFSYIGKKEVSIPVEAGRDVVDVILEAKSESIDDIVVIAYGTRKKNTVAGSVASVSAKSIQDAPVASFDQALQGKATGLTVLQNTGEPSAPATFQIRGVNSINSGTAPLFILDGIAVSSSDFSALNPADIQSVSVLKDAASTSIYGARAANGVIVITTKRGAMGTKARVNASVQYGVSDLAYGKWDIMNTAQRIQYEQEIGLGEGINYDALRGINVDWRDMVYNQSAPMTSYNINVSGASDVFNYYLSGNVHNQTGIAKGSSFDRYAFRANLEARAASWLKLGTNVTMSFEDISEATEGEYTTVTPISASRFMLPYWNPYNKDGSLASLSDGTWLGTNQNPLEWLENNPLRTTRTKVIGSVFLEIEPVKNFKIRSTFGVDATDAKVKTSSNPSYAPNYGQGMMGRSATTAYNITWTNLASYNFNKGKSDWNFLLGQETVSNEQEGFNFTGRGQNNDKLLNMSNATSVTSWGDFISKSSYLSVFARGEYNYDSRYYVEASVREDGSSKFGKNRQWATFWAGGFMWNAKGENFLRNTDWLSNAQASFSIGTSGNSSIPPYDHLALVGGGKLYNGVSGVSPISMGNEDLTWEKTRTINLGVKLGFLNRIDFGVEFYDKMTSDMLMEVPVSFATGYMTKWDNIGKMLNRGVEFDLNVNIINSRDFRWSVNGNASYNYNEIKELYNGRDTYEMTNYNTILQVGKPYGIFYLNRFAGVNPVNGDALWYDKAGELTDVLSADDRVLLEDKSWFAPWQGGFGTEFSWRGLSLSAQFSWVADRWMVNNDRWFDESNGMFASNNQSARLLNRWKKPGDISDIPRHGVFANEMDTRFLEDASFLRLKNLTLSYTMPSEWFLWSRGVWSGCRVYFQAQNLFTWTEFTGMDPESNMNIYQASYPMSRQFSFGVELTF